MKVCRRMLVGGLLALTVVALVMNVRCLFVAPVPNTWIWWSGDETWLMTKAVQQISTGHYFYPYAFGSIYSHESGFLAGSAWFTSLLYGLPAAIIHTNSVDVGRAVTFAVSLVTLLFVYVVSRRSGVSSILSALGVLLLATTTCFFITSHSARFDMLVGLSNLAVLSTAIGITFKNKWMENGAFAGMILLGCLLINLHVVLDIVLPLVFISWKQGFWKDRNRIMRAGFVAIFGLVALWLFRGLFSGTFSIVDPSDPVSSLTSVYRFFSPGAQRGNLLFRYFILNEWAPAYLWLLLPSLAGYFLLFRSEETRDRKSMAFLWIGSIALLTFASIYFENMLARYLIYLLPSLTIGLLLGIQSLWDFMVTAQKKWLQYVFAVSLFAIVVLSVIPYVRFAGQSGKIGAILMNENQSAINRVEQILRMEDSSKQMRVIAPVPVLYSLTMYESITPIVPYFLRTPESDLPIWDIVKKSRAHYALTCNSSAVTPDSEDVRLEYLIKEHALLMWETTGHFTDVGRSYVDDGLSSLDTIRLYKILQKEGE